jgi:hypothetical protein
MGNCCGGDSGGATNGAHHERQSLQANNTIGNRGSRKSEPVPFQGQVGNNIGSTRICWIFCL